MGRTSNIPFVIEKGIDGERTYDIYSRLFEERIIFIGEPIDDDLANSIVAQLLLLDKKDSSRDIFMYINSPGGSITAGLAIYDTMSFIRSDIRTVCVGMAASMAAVLLAAGTAGKRLALPNSRTMIHQPRQTGGKEVLTVTEQEIELKLIKSMKKQMADILSNHTKKSVKQILKDCELDNWMTAEEALKYGLVDEIIGRNKGKKEE